MNFKLGDIVVCINDDDCFGNLTKGLQYKIKDIIPVSPDTSYYTTEKYYLALSGNNINTTTKYYSSRFMLLPDNISPESISDLINITDL